MSCRDRAGRGDATEAAHPARPSSITTTPANSTSPDAMKRAIHSHERERVPSEAHTSRNSITGPGMRRYQPRATTSWPMYFSALNKAKSAAMNGTGWR